jgi:hypothetical protein
VSRSTSFFACWRSRSSSSIRAALSLAVLIWQHEFKFVQILYFDIHADSGEAITKLVLSCNPCCFETDNYSAITRALKLDFDRRLMVQFCRCVVTSDAGLLAYRELDDALGQSAVAGETLTDARTGKNGHHALVGLLRQSVFGRLAGL